MDGTGFHQIIIEKMGDEPLIRVAKIMIPGRAASISEAIIRCKV